MQDLIEINLKRDNCFHQLHTDGIVSLDLDIKMQFGNSLLHASYIWICFQFSSDREIVMTWVEIRNYRVVQQNDLDNNREDV